jgi:hypothetical protein
MSRDRFTLPLSCPRCGAAGSVTWEENSAVNPKGPQRLLIQVDGGFHAETGRTRSGDPLIVCNGCDQIQTD